MTIAGSTVDYKGYTDSQIKELELIQDIIVRMSDRQQSLKSIYLLIIGLMTAVVISKGVLMTRDGILASMIFETFMTIAIWRLDRAYLKVERTYRMWYDYIVYIRQLDNRHMFTLNLGTIKGILEETSIFNVKPAGWCKSWSLNIYLLLLISVGIVHGIIFFSRLVF